MIDFSAWKELFLKTLDDTFGDRVWFVGLQGSYGRGEATEASDLDMVVILDELHPEDIQTYQRMLDPLPHRELLCGFLSGQAEILNWDPADLFQFYHDTIPIRGSLDGVLPLLDDTAVAQAIKVGACNIYHGCVHNMIYEKSEDILRSLYKAASFVVQAICYRQTSTYRSRQRDLLEIAAPEERVMTETFIHLKKGGPVHFEEMSAALFNWSKRWINT